MSGSFDAEFGRRMVDVMRDAIDAADVRKHDHRWGPTGCPCCSRKTELQQQIAANALAFARDRDLIV